MIMTQEKTCYQCGSKLIELKRVVAFPVHTQSSTITVTYRCSSDDCQGRIDAKIAAMKKLRLEIEKRDIAKAALLVETRLKAKQAKEQLALEIAKSVANTKKS